MFLLYVYSQVSLAHEQRRRQMSTSMALDTVTTQPLTL